MDPESTVADRLGVPSGSTQTVVTCDQAIFSSVRTPMGQGYQIIAASKGLTPGEKREINQHSPSHGGLCEDGPDARGVAWYRLSSGRLALAHSADAGAEHSGRGARRIYTHITAMDTDDLAGFLFDPLSILRAVEATGAFEPDLKPPKELPALELAPVDGATSNLAEMASEQTGIEWVTYSTAGAMTGKRLVLGGELDAEALIGAILLGVPGPLRAELPCSAGLRFSIGRKYAIAVVGGDLKQTRRLVRGQRLEYHEPLSEDGTPVLPIDPWSTMVARHWRNGTVTELAEFSAQPIPDCSDETLARIGSICNETYAARTSGVDALLRMADARVDAQGANAFEDDLLLKLILAVQMRMCDRFRAVEDLETYWPAIASLLRRSARGADLALPVAAVVLERLSSTAPVRAAAYAVEAVEAAPDIDAADRLSTTLAAVLRSLRQWLSHASFDALEGAKSVLTEWRFKLPQFVEVDELLEHLEHRLAEAATN